MEWRFVSIAYHKLACLINSGRKYNVSSLAKETGFTSAHLSRVFDWWQECQLIVRRKEGQDTFIEFTEFGKMVFKDFDAFAKQANKATKNREVTNG